MLGTLRRFAGLARAEQPKGKPEASQRAAMRRGIRADGNSAIDPMGAAPSPSPNSMAVWQRAIDRMHRTN
jgi:hypothetical protein